MEVKFIYFVYSHFIFPSGSKNCKEHFLKSYASRKNVIFWQKNMRYAGIIDSEVVDL